MGKSSKSTTSSLPAPTKRPAASEIDDIFANKRAKTETQPQLLEVKVPSVSSTGEKAKSKKNKKGKEKETGVQVESEVVTIVDPSTKMDVHTSFPPSATTGSSKKRGAMAAEEELFMDSRGTARRRTDDGLAIYDISELKIGLGGDTEMCPFDCECCF